MAHSLVQLLQIPRILIIRRILLKSEMKAQRQQEEHLMVILLIFTGSKGRLSTLETSQGQQPLLHQSRILDYYYSPLQVVRHLLIQVEKGRLQLL